MANIAIFRKANANQISTLSHLINNHELTNQDINLNPNKDNLNTVYVFKDGELMYDNFKRDGTNQALIDEISKIEKDLDKEAREDYTKYKLEQKKLNPDKKIRTVLQSKSLKKEFLIAVGGDCQIDKQQFEKDVINTAFKILEHKGLEPKNLIALVVHEDESSSIKASEKTNKNKGIHIHCQYSDYNFSKHTTATQLEKPQITKDMTPEEKKQAHKKSRETFSLFQDLTADGLGMERGKKDSRVKHKTKAQFYEETAKEVEKLEVELSSKTKELKTVKNEVEEAKKLTNAEINNLANSKRKLQDEYNDFEDDLRQKVKHLIEIKNQLRINSNMPYLPAPEMNLDILIAGLNKELGLNWKLKDLAKTYIAGQYALNKLSYPDLPKLIKNAEDLSKRINERLELEDALVRKQRTR